MRKLKRLKKYLLDDTFLLTYCDGLSDINIKELVKFHHAHKKMVTISAVRPPARFVALSLEGNEVIKFKQKTQLGQSFINGGFFVIDPKFFELIDGDKTALESTPLEKVTILKEIRAFKHEGFWQCMDHKLDKDLLDQMIKNGKTPWIKK